MHKGSLSRKNNLFVSILPILLLFISVIGNSQSRKKENIFSLEKISVGAGIGLEYGVIGMRGKYYFNDYLGSSLGLGTVFVGRLIWNVGLDFRVPKLATKRFAPYANVMYGANASLIIEDQNSKNINKLYRGISTSLGIKINVIPKLNSYITIGINYRFLNGNIAKFVEDYNQEFGTNVDRNYSSVFPVFGYTYCFK